MLIYSTRCTNCKQVFQLKQDEIQAIVAEGEEKKLKFYPLPCPKCRRPVKIQIRDLKRKLTQVPAETPNPEGDSTKQ